MNLAELIPGRVFAIEYHDAHTDYSFIGEALYRGKNPDEGFDFQLPDDVEHMPRDQAFPWYTIGRHVPNPTKTFNRPLELSHEDNDTMKKTKRQQPLKKNEQPQRIIHQVTLSDAEMAQLGQDTGRTRQEIAELQAQLKSIATDFKARIEAKTAAVTALETKLANRYEMREVDSICIFDPAARRKQYVNTKNRKEVFREEDMTPADFELPMFSRKELDATKTPGKGKPAATDTPPGAIEKNGAGGKVSVDDDVIAAAKTQTKVEIDVDDYDSFESNPVKLEQLFYKKAKKMQWAPTILSKFRKIAQLKAAEGVPAIVEFLRPFTVEQGS